MCVCVPIHAKNLLHSIDMYIERQTYKIVMVMVMVVMMIIINIVPVAPHKAGGGSFKDRTL